MSFLAPLFIVGLGAIAVPIFVHLIQRERKDIIAFPSLMFIRKIPYQSVERRRIHNWFLLLLRTAAMALIVLAFARPFLKEDPLKAAAAATGAREVVILLDRSASMGYGDHWAKAQAAARQVVDGLSGDDRATLVLFDRSAEENVRATPDHARLSSAIDEATVSSDSTRYAPALRLAQSLLSRSDRARKEAVLISDFQKTGWAQQEEIHLPEGAKIAPVSVADANTSDLLVSSIAIARAVFSGEERATVTAGLVNHGKNAVSGQPVELEVDGHLVDTRPVSIDANGSGSVTFQTVTVSQPNMRAVVRAGTDALPKDNAFYFVLSPSEPLSVLLIQPDSADRNASLYITTGLDTSKSPPFKTDVVAASRVTPGQFEHRSIVILNDATTLSSATADLVHRFVDHGGGLFIVLGDHTPFAGDTSLVPGVLGQDVDRLSGRGGTLGFLDYSHPIFDEFKDPRNGNFANMRFWRYRSLMPAPNDHVLARFDDGGAALVERRVGSGRVVAFTSTLDADWNEAPKDGMFLPFLDKTMKYLAQYEQPEAWQTVGRMLDISSAVGSVVRQGQATVTAGTAGGGAGVVVSPTGAETTLGAGGAASVELAEQGFYSVRLPGIGDRRPYTVAVDMDPAESDLTPLEPAQFLASATGRPAATMAGQSLEQPEVSSADVEKKQAIWWFLLVAGVVLLIAESVLANRLSKRALPQGEPAAG